MRGYIIPSAKVGGGAYLQMLICHHGEGQLKGKDTLWLQQSLRITWRRPKVILQPADITETQSKYPEYFKNINHP